MKEHTTTIIDNEKYFAMIDNQVRKLVAQFETEQCLPWAEQVYTDAGKPELKEFPVEGYYYKSDLLKRYFQLIRNFQQNEEVYKKVKESCWLENLRKVLHTELFGNEVPPGEFYPWPDAPLKRRWDLMTYTMSDKKKFDDSLTQPWTIPLIMEALIGNAKNLRNLPELAVMIGKPELICAACETNSLGRMFAWVSGSMGPAPIPPNFIWNVNSEVEKFGKEICQLYNQITTPFGINYRFGSSYEILPPTLELCELTYKRKLNPAMDWELECPRVAHLGYVRVPDLNYFWILDNNGTLTDLYQKEMLTTEQYRRRTMTDYSWAWDSSNVGIKK